MSKNNPNDDYKISPKLKEQLKGVVDAVMQYPDHLQYPYYPQTKQFRTGWYASDDPVRGMLTKIPCHVIFLNGKSRSGKGTAIEFFKRYADDNGASFGTISSIQCIIDKLNEAGIDTSDRTDKDRKLLADFGTIMEEYCDFRSDYVEEKFRKFMSGYMLNKITAFYYVIEIREYDLMDKIIKKIQEVPYELDMQFHKVYVENPRITSVPNNAIDQSVENKGYDFVLMNDGTLGKYLDECYNFLDQFAVLDELKKS